MYRRKESRSLVPSTNAASLVAVQNAIQRMVANDLFSRTTLAYSAMTDIGVTHNGARDLYTILGYKKSLTFDDYLWRYERQDIATRVVTAFPSAVWSMKPLVFESDTPEADTPFEKAFEDLIMNKKVYHYLTRADKLSGIGRFGIIVLGFADNRKVFQPLIKKNNLKLIYMRPYHEGSVKIKSYDSDLNSERYGQPEMYTVQTAIPELSNANQQQARKGTNLNEIDVHWTRVIHVLPELGSENDIYAEPRLKNVYNRLQDIETISGGSAEMFWRGAFQGLAFKNDEGATMTTANKDALTNEIEDYVNNLKRYIKLQNMDVTPIETQVADPKNHFDIQMTLVSAARGIPKRILLGSERGELASNQDENNWLMRVDERRVDHAESLILRPFIDRLIEFGALPTPAKPYTVEWPDLYSASGIDQAKIAQANMISLKDYLTMQGDQVIPVDVFLEKELKYTPRLVRRCMKEFDGIETQEQQDIANDDTSTASTANNE
jgi:hypothetical protein